MIRHFLYLDEQKMYSLSSQLFEGITEYILNENTSDKKEETQQKGPIASGRILADVINSTVKSSEKRFLHDYSYNLLEKKLIEQKNILEVNNENINEIEKYSFIKIKAKATFNDINKINELFQNFNKLGEGITRLTVEEEIEKKIKLASSSDELLKIESESKKLRDDKHIHKLAKERNLYKNEKFLNELTMLTNYGFSEEFEIQQKINNYLFTSTLNRDFLREKENILIKKYARKTEKDIFVVGIITQTSKENIPNLSDIQVPKNMRQGLSGMIEHLNLIEYSLFGKAENEIIIDPIAVYTEL